MENNNIQEAGKKKAVIGVIIAVVAFVVAGLLFGWFSGSSKNKNEGQTSKQTGEQKVLGEDVLRPNDANALLTVEGGTREKVAQNVATPDANATGTPKNIAVPTSVVKTGNVAFRQFTITGDSGKFSPSTIVVNEGDVIDITLNANDASYSIFFSDFGVYGSANKGETKKIQFQATRYGQYKFVCNDVCKPEISGMLIVNTVK